MIFDSTKLRRHLKMLGIKHKALADMIGASGAMLSNFMRGKLAYPQTYITKIAEVLNLDQKALFSGKVVILKGKK